MIYFERQKTKRIYLSPLHNALNVILDGFVDFFDRKLTFTDLNFGFIHDLALYQPKIVKKCDI